MHHQVFTKLALDSAGTASEVSRAIPMEGGNAFQVDGTIYNLTGTSVTFQVQQSNDQENWTNVGGSSNQLQGAFLLAAVTGVSAAYVRLKCTINGTGKAALSAGINVTLQ
jgi:hypothetical protein